MDGFDVTRQIRQSGDIPPSHWSGEGDGLGTIRYTRSPSGALDDTTLSPSFLRSIPEMAPRTVCGCQLVTSISCSAVAP